MSGLLSNEFTLILWRVEVTDVKRLYLREAVNIEKSVIFDPLTLWCGKIQKIFLDLYKKCVFLNTFFSYFDDFPYN